MEGSVTYDVVVVGAGSAGCIVAARIAERGVNPRTGDRLRIALIEGGPYYFKGGPPRPGYGDPERRRRITNIRFLEFKPQPWPYDGLQNKMVGGCGLHWGGNAYLPFDEDFDHWRQVSGVDWSPEKFAEAKAEITQMYHIHSSILENMNRGNLLFHDAASSLGYKVTPVPMSRYNCINCGYCGSGHFCKYDAKGTTLPYIDLAERNGVEIIPDAEVEKILIEKRGTTPVAEGVRYVRSGQAGELRADKVIVTCGTSGTPVLLLRSGYGPREVLGDRTIVENPNVGKHLDGDIGRSVVCLFDVDLKDGSRGGVERWQLSLTDSRGRHGWMNVQMNDSPNCSVDEMYPHLLAFHPMAPEFGWEHKEFMRTAGKRVGGISVTLRAPDWERGVVDPNGKHLYRRDDPAILKRLDEGAEVALAIIDRMNPRPVRVNRKFPNRYTVSHNVGTCRAGENRKTSVVNSDFECHDVENLFLASGEVVPSGSLGHSHIPICTVAAYAWRRIVANHFSRGTA